jgi:hypothetical protein
MDPDPDPDPTLDPTPFTSNLHIIFSLKKFNFLINFVLKFYFASITVFFFQSDQHLNEKREGSGSGTGTVPLTNGFCSGSGRPKNIRIRFRIRIPNTAFYIN